MPAAAASAGRHEGRVSAAPRSTAPRCRPFDAARRRCIPRPTEGAGTLPRNRTPASCRDGPACRHTPFSLCWWSHTTHDAVEHRSGCATRCNRAVTPPLAPATTLLAPSHVPARRLRHASLLCAALRGPLSVPWLHPAATPVAPPSRLNRLQPRPGLPCPPCPHLRVVVRLALRRTGAVRAATLWSSAGCSPCVHCVRRPCTSLLPLLLISGNRTPLPSRCRSPPRPPFFASSQLSPEGGPAKAPHRATLKTSHLPRHAGQRAGALDLCLDAAEAVQH